MRSKTAYAFWTVVALAQVGRAEDKAPDYLRDIKPLLQARCYACHGGLRRKGGLRLDTCAALLSGGDSGPVVEPGKSAASLIIDRVTGAGEDRMPPEGEGEALKPEQIAKLRAWIDAGAKRPDQEAAPPDPRKHWAFVAPVRPGIPAVADPLWRANPIDAFIAAERTTHALDPVPEADRPTLLRRVYLDLIGLPPTRDELEGFVADTSPGAYAKVVESLLASPRYGERWGRHWMDIWRYSDWYGRRDVEQHRNSRRNIWRWRDWIVESVNADKPYDQMIREMFAADEIAPTDLAMQRATGYLGRTWYAYNRNVWLQDTIEYTTTAFLGLTFKCCRCHDHKYDPISQEEYYQLRAFFEPYGVRTDRVVGKPEMIYVDKSDGTLDKHWILKEGFDRVYDAQLEAKTYLFVRGNEKAPKTDEPLSPGVPSVLGGEVPQITPVSLPFEVTHPDQVLLAREDIIADAAKRVESARAEMNDAKEEHIRAFAESKLKTKSAKLAAVQARIAADLARLATPPDPRAAQLAKTAERCDREVSVREAEEVRQEMIFNVVNLRRKLDCTKPEDAKRIKAAEERITEEEEKVVKARQTLAQPLTGKYEPIGPEYPATSSGRRLAFAKWLSSRRNPLTARVAVNHIWMRHFGTPLVPNVFNFGLSGKPPTHPALLDWLAVELMDHGWSTKYLHRLMVTSRTYCMQSHAIAGNSAATADPDNKYYWRMNPHRMESEVLRDSLLHLAGRLDLTSGGPDLDPEMKNPPPRRSLWFRHTPDDKVLMLALFDAPDPEECFRRVESVVPQQALALSNSEISLDHSRILARQITDMVGSGSAVETTSRFVKLAFEQVLSRSPSDAERAKCVGFLDYQSQVLADVKKLTPLEGLDRTTIPPAADARQRAREDLVHVLFNYNEFVTIR